MFICEIRGLIVCLLKPLLLYFINIFSLIKYFLFIYYFRFWYHQLFKYSYKNRAFIYRNTIPLSLLLLCKYSNFCLFWKKLILWKMIIFQWLVSLVPFSHTLIPFYFSYIWLLYPPPSLSIAKYILNALRKLPSGVDSNGQNLDFRYWLHYPIDIYK